MNVLPSSKGVPCKCLSKVEAHSNLSDSCRLLGCYLSLQEEFSLLLVYISAAVTMKYANQVKKMPQDQSTVLLQNLPTEEWGEEDIEMLLAEAHLYKKCYPPEMLTSEKQ